MRGEYYIYGFTIMVATGSSPHARGIPLPFLPTAQKRRFIPACAGNTRRLHAGLAGPWVHPRMRGEYTKKM